MMQQLSVVKSLAKKNVFLTGATGFVGKVLVEKILRDVPDIGKLFLLIRNNAKERLETDILASKVFDRLKEERADFLQFALSKLVAISGDVLEANLGLNEKEHRRIVDEVNIVIHCAATVDFKERLDDAVRKNVLGTLQVFELARSLKHLDCFIHVSTAFVNSDRFGFHEEVLPPLTFDPEEMVQIILQMEPAQLEKATPHMIGKYPNTYTFTKAITERILDKKRGDMPITFVRPTIIGCSLQEPVPGWIDSVSAIAAMVLFAGVGLVRFIQGDYQKITDVVPVDTVTNVILAAIPATIGQNKLQILHVGTSHVNPVRWYESARWCGVYWRQHNVKRRINPEPLYFRFYKNKQMYEIRNFFSNTIPTKLYSGYAKVLGTPEQKKNAALLKKVSTRTQEMTEIFTHFSMHEWIYSIRNTEQIMSRIVQPEREKFYLGLRDMDWEHYFRYFCYGMQKYVLKEDVRPPTDLLKIDLVQEPRKLQDDTNKYLKQYFPDFAWAFKTYRTHIGIDSFATLRTTDETKALIIKSPRVQEAIKKVAVQESVDESVINTRANSVLDRMAHTLRLPVVRALGWFLRKVWKRIYSGIHVDEKGIENFRKILGNGPVLLIPTHRSYIDFLLISYLFFEYDLPMPHIAAGEDFLGILFVNWIFRNSGAFFLRRSFKGDTLYIALFTEYVQRLICDWSPIEFFIEGKRSRTGKSLHPKFGLLSIALEPFLNRKVPDVTVIPISITYEKILEAELYSGEMMGEKKIKESLEGLLKASKILKMNFGRINVVFNDPISVKSYVNDLKIDPFVIEDDRKKLMEHLGYKIVYDLNQGLVITPSALVGTVVLIHRKGITTGDLNNQVNWLREEATRRGFQVTHEGTTKDLVENGLKMISNLISRTRNTIQPIQSNDQDKQNKNLLVLSVYRNQILHVFSAEGMVACALSSCKDGMKKQKVIEGSQFLNKLLWLEFVNKPSPNLEEDFHAVLHTMVERGWLSEEHGTINITPRGEGPVAFLGNLFWPFVDSYWAAAVALYSLQPNLSVKRSLFTQRVQWLAEKMVSEDKLSFYESSSMETLVNALELFQQWQVIGIKKKNENAPKATGKKPSKKDRRKPAEDPLYYLMPPYQKESTLQDLIMKINEFRKVSTGISKETLFKRAIISDLPLISSKL